MVEPLLNETPAGDRLRGVRSLLGRAMLKDRASVRRKLKALFDARGRSALDSRAVNKILAAVESRLEASIREKDERIRQRPSVRYPRGLPIVARRHDIIGAIKTHQVIIISGETGCGKSTQIPKMCLEAGRGIAGKIACTQPRRIAAITIAHRIAEELSEPLGRSVGYKIRFQDRTPQQAYLKIMTDGMLLAETQTDPRLFEYDTLIIDEAHERSLNIDFLLGISRKLLQVRPELKLIVTSATLDTEKFSKAFGHTPVIQVGGRMYPVEVEYEPDEDSHGPDKDIIDRAVAAVEKLRSRPPAGDILIFMPTEQDILETCERLEGRHSPAAAILPLYARLPASRQGRIYSVHGPKIVVATNVAETSLTIPGIRYVIDTGLARISQYQPGTRINSLPVSLISKASADQRMGRCGRIQHGHCIRLYSRQDYESRSEFTPPEILRSNLAGVILRMIALKLGAAAEFPFVDMPPPKAIKDGTDTLLELGAITGKGRDLTLTPLGRRMARIPLDPKVSRMLLEAEKEGCLREVAVIASALSIRDPKERPSDQAGEADARHALFRHPESDFLTLLNIWDACRKVGGPSRSRNKLENYCKENFLSYPRLREWGFVYDQVLSILEEQKIRISRRETIEMSKKLYASIHRSILGGFLSNLAVHKEKNIYSATKGREVTIFPGSVLSGKSPAWIVAAEMVQTSRLFARTAAKIDAGWLEEVGGDFCRSTYSDPLWDKERGEVMAKEKVTLYGLEIVSGRNVSYQRINPEEAHQIFVRSALVEGDVKEPPSFLGHNLELVRKVSEIEEKLRRRDILVGEEERAEFYSTRLAGIADIRNLERIIRSKGSDGFLRMNEKDLMRTEPAEKEATARAFPDNVEVDGRRFRAAYKFAPGEEADGITLKVPAGLVKSLPAEPLEWGVPGQYKEKVAAILKGLPKRYRKLLLPAAEKVEIIVREMKPEGPSLFKTLARFVQRRFQIDIPAAEWAKAELPLHLRMRVAVIDDRGREIAAARNLDILRQAATSETDPADSPAWRDAMARWERTGLKTWDFGPLPDTVAAGPYAVAYPGLEAAENGINLRLFKTREQALASHIRGVEALLRPRFAKDAEFVKRTLVLSEDDDASALFFGGRAAILKRMSESLGREVFRKNIRSPEDYAALAARAVRALFEKGAELRELTLKILDAYLNVRRLLLRAAQTAASPSGVPRQPLAGSPAAELERLVPPDFLEIYPLERLRHLPRYLEALKIRAERAKFDPDKDRKKQAQLRPFEELLEIMNKNPITDENGEKRKAVEDFRWMIEEFKVSLFAPEIKTAFPVSPKRLAMKIKEIDVKKRQAGSW